jgi:cephalosporin hydroxylase
MDPVFQFHAERAVTIDSYSKDKAFDALSQDWLRSSMGRRYVYNFDWLGRPIVQYPQDMVAVQELIWATRPDIVIETGIAHGGSLILSASMLALLDYADAVAAGQLLDPKASSRKVIGIDIDIRAHNRIAIESHPLAHKIEMIQGSSTDQDTIARVKAAVPAAARVMVCLDSMHTHDHVLAELRAYGPLVSPGCYCIVFDSFIEDMPVDFFADRPWNVGNNPKTALHSWLAEVSDFEIDSAIAQKLMVTVAPDGYLRRKG